FFQAEDGIRDKLVTGVQTCALPISPNINEPILGGRAQITGQFTVQSANDLAVSLASGKLPVKLNVIEERTVSAELGADSIHKGRSEERRVGKECRTRLGLEQVEART